MRLFILFFFASLVFPDSCNMELAGSLEFDQGLSDITGFYQDGREFAVVGLFVDAVAFIDITNPDSVFEVGRISADNLNDNGNAWRDLKYWNRHVYIGTEASDGVKVISVDDPDNPTLVNTITDFTSSHNIHIDVEGFLYVVGAADHDIWIYDLTIPENPLLVGTWDGEYLHDIEVYNKKVYGAGIYTGFFYIIDVSDKSNPTTLLSYDTGGGYISTHDCAVTEDEHYLITADETVGGHIKIWDISDYTNINLVSEYMTHPEHSVHNVYVRPETNLVIISYYVDGTRVLDITDPVNPVEVGYYDTSDLTGLYDGNWGTYVYLPSGYIISSDRQNGLFIFSSPLSEDSLDWVACGPIAPLKPSLTAEALLDTIILTWDNVSENSIDGSTGLQDFEGYRVYRSNDGGETWGNEEDMIYDSTGDHVGWKPYVQFDYTYDEDNFLYGYYISGADPLAPWIDLGSNTGIKHSLTDLDVYPYAEYCYVLTAYDTGIQPGYISDGGILYEEGYASLESDFHNMVCKSPTTPDFNTPPTENIFIESDTNIGWDQVSYIPHSVDTVNTGIYKFEIHAEIDTNTFLNSKTLNPKLFVYEIDESGNQISDYLSEGFPIYSIDEEVPESDAWLDILGMYVKIENFYTSLTNVFSLVEMEETFFSDPTLSDRIDIKMKWYSEIDLPKQPYFDYQIEFSSSTVDTAIKITPGIYSCYTYSDLRTLLPFRITNLTLDNQIDLYHTDRGILYDIKQYGEASAGAGCYDCINGMGEECIDGDCIVSEGYANCNWERNETLPLIDILPDRDEKFFKLKIGFNMDEYYNYVGADPSSTDTWAEGATYSPEDIVYYKGMLWKASVDIAITNPPDEWFDNDGDDVNDNPWIILYPWEDGDTATLSIKKLLHDGDSWLVNTDLFNQSPLNNTYLSVMPVNFKLAAPYPNPFNPVTQIEYSLPYASDVSLTVYDLLGRQVEILHNGNQTSGYHTIRWDASKHSSGLYFIHMISKNYIETQKLMLKK